jgi:hypothetical protein
MRLHLTTDLIALGAGLQLLCQLFRSSDRDVQTFYIRFHVCKAHIFASVAYLYIQLIH